MNNKIRAKEEQLLTILLQIRELWGNDANGDFLFVLSDFSFVVATSILAVTERVGATFRRKNIFLLVALPKNPRLLL